MWKYQIIVIGIIVVKILTSDAEKKKFPLGKCCLKSNFVLVIDKTKFISRECLKLLKCENCPFFVKYKKIV